MKMINLKMMNQAKFEGHTNYTNHKRPERVDQKTEAQGGNRIVKVWT